MSDASTEVRVVFVGNADELAQKLADALEAGTGKTMKAISAKLSLLLRAVGDEGSKSGKQTASAWARAAASVKDYADALKLGERRTKDFAKIFSKIKAPEAEFERFIQLEEVAARKAKELAQISARSGATSPQAVQARKGLEEANKMLAQQGAVFRKLTDVGVTEYKKISEQARVSQQGQTTVARAEASERIVAMQTEAAKETAIIRAAGQRRIAIIRAVVGQIRALERGLAAVFRATGRSFATLGSAVGRGVGRIASVFNRSNAQMSAGLSGAMSKRESILRTSMSRQERIIQSSTQRQSVQMARLERASSRGIAGVVSGRSQLGTLLGGGLAIGGGFALIGMVKNLATAGADFTQGLAVLDAQLGLTDRQMKRVHDTALELGNDITLPGVSALDAAEAIQILGKQFGSLGKGAVPAALAASKGVLQLSRATQSTAEDAARVVGSAVNVFGIEASKAVDVADQVAGALTKAAGVSLQDFALTFRQGAGVFAGFQVAAVGADQALLDFNTSIAVLAKAGLVGSDAGTSLKQFFLQANRGTVDSTAAMKNLVERAGETGGAFFDAAHKARPFQESLDIIRRGMEGMSDEAKQKTLQKMFGSDAINAAKALLGTSEDVFTSIQRGIQKQGLAAEIAAAQNTGLRGAMDALNSIIETQGILVYEKLNVVLGNVVLSIAEFLNQLLTGEGVFATIRTALKGIALGLGSILAAKGAVEIFRFLLILARGLLTPLGLIALVAAGVGAAFTLMMENSKEFRQAVEEIVPKLQEFGRTALDFVKARLEDLADFLGRQVIPRIADFITFIGTKAISGLKAFADFIGRTIIPPLKEFASLLVDTVLPAVVDGLVAAFDFARDAIQSFWDVAQPILQPAIDGIVAFGEAVADLFDLSPSKGLLAIGGILAAAVGGFAVAGPLGAVVAGLGASVAAIFATGLDDELGSALSGIGESIVDALRGPFETVKNFLGNIFTAENLKNVTFAFLDVVEEIGRILGSIVSDPRLIAALAGIVAFAAAVAAKFVLGFAQGVLENVPELTSMLRDALGEAINQAFSFIGLDIDIGKPIATALLAAFAGFGLLRLLTGAATKLGISTGRALGTAVAKGTQEALTVGGAGFGAGPKGFLQGLLGGPGLQRAVERDMRKVTGAIDTEIRRMSAAVRGAGRLDLLAGMTIDRAGLQKVRSAFQEVERSMGSARVAGAQFRTSLGDVVAAARRFDVRGIARGLGDAGAALAGQGRNIGTAAGTAIAGAIGIAFGAQMINESKGIGDTVQGLVTVIGSAMMALAVGGGPLAAVTAGLGLIVTVFQQIQGQADEAKARVQAFLDAIKGADGAEERADAIREVWTSMFEEMDPKGVQLLVDAGVNIRELTDAALEGGPAVSDALAQVRENLEAMVDAGKIPADAVNVIMGTLENRIGEIDTAVAKFDAINILEDQITGLDPRVRSVSTAFGTMFATPPTDAVTPEIEEVDQKLFEVADQADIATEAISVMFGAQVSSNLQQSIDDLIQRIPTLISTVAGLDLTTFLGRATRRGAVDDFVGGFLDDMEEAIADGEITTVPQFKVQRGKVLKGLRETLDAATKGPNAQLTLDEANVLFEEIKAKFMGVDLGDLRQLIQDYIDGQAEPAVTISTKGTPRVTIDPAVQRPRGIAKAVQQFFDEREATKVTLNVEGRPKLTITESMSDADVLAAIQDWVGGGTGGSTPTGGGVAGGRVMLRSVQKPLEVPVPISAKPVITVSETAGGAKAVVSEALAKALADVTLNVPVTINPIVTVAGGGQLSAVFALVGVGLGASFAQGIASTSGAASAAASTVASGALGGFTGFDASSIGAGLSGTFASGVSSVSASGAASTVASGALGGFYGFSAYSAGLDLSYGFASGIRDGASAAVNAAASMAQAAVNAARSVLQTRSPSKVFRNIGRDIGRGLALGLADSESDITSAVTEAVDKAIEAAQRRVPNQAVARAQTAAQIFERTTLPSRLPGGIPDVEVARSAEAADVAIGELLRALNEAKKAAREAFNEEKRQRQEIIQANKEIQRKIDDRGQKLEDRLREIKDVAFERLIQAFEKREVGLGITRQRVNLGGLQQQFKQAFQELLPDFKEEKAKKGETADERADRERRNREGKARLDEARKTRPVVEHRHGRWTRGDQHDPRLRRTDPRPRQVDAGRRRLSQRNHSGDEGLPRPVDQGRPRCRDQWCRPSEADPRSRTDQRPARQLRRHGREHRQEGQGRGEESAENRRRTDHRFTGQVEDGAGRPHAGRRDSDRTAEPGDHRRRPRLDPRVRQDRVGGRTANRSGGGADEADARRTGRQRRGDGVQPGADPGPGHADGIVQRPSWPSSPRTSPTPTTKWKTRPRRPPRVSRAARSAPARGCRAGSRDVHVHLPFGDPEAVGLYVVNKLAFELNAPA